MTNDRDGEAQRRMIAARMGIVAEPAEIAGCVLFLASDAVADMTGATLDVNGGVLMVSCDSRHCDPAQAREGLARSHST